MTKDRIGRPVTSVDVARLAGVSRSAVSRTFTSGASVAPATREKVMRAAKELGYRVNFLARDLSRQRSDLVGLVVSDMDHSFRARLVDELSRRLVSLGYRPFLLPTGPGEDVSRLTDMMLHYKVAGAIVTSDTPPAEIAQECAAHGVPLVLVNKPDVGVNVARILMDTEKAGRLAAEALHAVGCRRIGIASQTRPSYSIGLRKHAFIDHCGRLGLEIVADFRGSAHNYTGGTEAGKDFLASGIGVEAVYCVNDYLALGFLDHVRHKGGMRVPEDIKVIACDDIAEAGWLSYDLTTVRQDSGTMAEAAVNALLRRLDQPEDKPGTDMVDVSLVWRGSTGKRPDGFQPT